MQILSLHAALLTFLGSCIAASGSLLRRASRDERFTMAVSSAPTSGAIALANSQEQSVKNPEGKGYEVVKKESIERKKEADCLCKMGSFWHWRIKSCIKQGGWAYECGFFPAEHHNKVCQDGLKCEPLNQTKVKYVHPGAVPASCVACETEDKCLSGKERHEKNCLKEYKLSGSACQTVSVSAVATASAEVTEKVTKEGSATATATATASEKATAEGKSATKKATAEGKSTATAKASSEASATAKATKKASAEGKGCISVEEVKKLMNLQDVPRIGAVLSAEVVARGDKEAFDLAYAKALEAAEKAGLISATEAAKALASAEAREHAGLEAQAKAEEAAAWKAEAGAEAAAQENAKAEALAKAKAAATAEAAAAAGTATKAAAEAAAAEAAARAAEGLGDKASADAARKKAEEAKARSDAAAAAAAEAKARQDAISDVVNSKPKQAPARPTTPEPTSPPRKISPAEIAAKLP